MLKVKKLKNLSNYLIYSNGEIYSLKRKCFMKQLTNSDGYKEVHLTLDDGTNKHFRVHRLVALAFIPNENDKPNIDHINTIRSDNRIENLRWVSQKENNNNSIFLKRYREIGIKNFSKHQIRCLENGKVYRTHKEAAEDLQIKNYSHITDVCRGVRKKTQGFHFEYV